MNEFEEAIIRRLESIESRLSKLETAALHDVRLGPGKPTALDLESVARRIEQTFKATRPEKEPEPVDYSARILADGKPIEEGEPHREIEPTTGQQKAYVVLTPEERAKGFIRPVRRSYVHQKCGSMTTMGIAIAETYARAPGFYSGTFCCKCRAHFPIGEDGEFVWEDGTKVGL